jgi:hypothetical protein
MIDLPLLLKMRALSNYESMSFISMHEILTSLSEFARIASN